MTVQWHNLLPESEEEFEDQLYPPPIDHNEIISEALPEGLPTDDTQVPTDANQGFQVPTDESLDRAVDSSFNQMRPGLKDSELLGSLEWEDPKDISDGSGNAAPVDTSGINWHNVEGEVAEDDDYGWGIKNAFMRGLIRAGSLIDIAQGDVEEYAEGMKELENYQVSEEDQARLQELQSKDGFWEAIGYYVTNPALAMQVVVESLPMSTAPLVGGAAGAIAGTAVGGPIGTIAGGAVGAGLGSFGTEYLASIGDAVSEHGVDTTNANELRAAFADDKFMATAREHAAKRGIGVAAFDALSMGIAGRIYRPIAGLKKTAEGVKKAASKTRAVVGGTSEILAQASAGAAGEISGQFIAGDEYDPIAAASEFIGEIVPGVAEIAINKSLGRDAVGTKPDVPPDADPLGDPSDVTAAGDVPADVLDSIPETDVDIEGKPYIVPEAIEPAVEETAVDTETSAAPEPETATTPTAEKAPSAPVAAEPTQAVEETVEPLKEETPLITAKDLKPKINEQLTGTAEEQKPVRAAWKSLVDAVRQRYPDVELPTVGGRFSGAGLGKFFQALQEQVDIRESLPNLKAYLEEVSTGTPAETIKSLERVTSGVVADIESTTVGKGGPILTQLRAVVNKFTESVKVRGKKKGGAPARHLIQHANEVGELATGVKAAVTEGEKLGALEGLPSDFNKTISAAQTVAHNAQAPREVRTTAGNKQLKVDRTSRKHLDMLGKKLMVIAEQLSEAIASAETSVSFDALEASIAELDALIDGTTVKTKAAKKTSKAKSGGTKAKVTPRKAITKPVSEEKKTKIDAEAGTTVTSENLVAGEQGLYAIEKPHKAKKAVAKSKTKTKPKKKGKLASAVKEAKKGMGMADMLKTKAERAVEKKTPAKTKKVKAKSKAKTKAKKKGKKKVRGANPEEVFDPQVTRGISGREATNIVEDSGMESPGLVSALEEAGVSKAAADKLRAIYKSVSKKQAKKIQAAAESFIEHGEQIRLIAEIASIVEATPSVDVVNTLMEFSNALRTDQETGSARGDMIAEYAAESDMSLENAEAILEDSGAIDPADVDSFDRGGDQFFAPFDHKALTDLDNSLDHTNLSRGDRILLSKSMEKMRGFFNGLVRPATGSFLNAIKNMRSIPTVTMQDVLLELGKALPKNHRYAVLVERLKKLNLTVPITFHDNLYSVHETETAAGVFHAGAETDSGTGRYVYNQDKSNIKLFYDPLLMSDSKFIHNLLHEMVHAATLHAYETDSTYQHHMKELWRQALTAFIKQHPDAIGLSEELKAKIKDPRSNSTSDVLAEITGLNSDMKTFYGLANPIEMIAEAFTNPRFQMFLGSIEVEVTPEILSLGTIRSEAMGGGYRLRAKSILGQMIMSIKRFLGYSARNSVLNEIIFSVERFGFSSQTDINRLDIAMRLGHKNAWGTKMQGPLPIPTEKKEVTPHSAEVQNILDGALSSRSGIGKVADAIREALTKMPRAINLGFMNRDVIERKYRDLFARAAEDVGQQFNPLTQYVKAKQAASVLARIYEKKAYGVLQRAAKLKGKTRAKMYALMRDTTISMVWPDKPLNHAANKHLWSKPNKKTGATMMLKKTAALAKQARKDFIALQKSNPEATKIMMELATLTKEIQAAKQAGALEALGKSYELTGSEITALKKLSLSAQVDNMFPPVDEATLADLQPDKSDSKERKAEKTKSLAEVRQHEAINRAAKIIIHGTSIKGPYFPLRRYGDYVVSTSEADEGEAIVTFHSTRAEAQRISDAFNAEGRTTYVSRKLQSQAVSADLESVAVEITSRLKGPDSSVMKSRLQTALIESLATNTAYASELRRNNVDGVAASDMGRALEEYVHVSKYTIGDLTTSHEVQEALTNLKKLQTAEETSVEDRLLIGEVVNEIGNQNREDANDREMSSVQTAVGALGFFNFLGAPSYWVLNATQTYTVTLPYLTAKWGMKGPAALASAQKTVLAAASKALVSKDKSYEGFKAQLPPAALRIVERLEDSNILQSTIAHEFGDILNPGGIIRMVNSVPVLGKPANLALKAMEKVPEAVEHFNRISTGLAIYSLSGDIVAVEDGVQATQFNYDSANRARLLKALPMPAGGGARAVVTPIMMFKTYGIGIARLLYGSMVDIVRGKDRATAVKMAGGLIVSHTIFGGVAGGLMLAPIAGLIGVFNQVFREAGDEFDPEEAVEEFLRDAGYDAMATMARRGVPAAALGIDMSKSINLGNLLWMGNDRINFAESGGVETGLTTALGPVAQYGITSVREGVRLFSGDNRGNWADFLAAVIPLKVARGVIKASVYATEGLHTDADLQFLDADQLASWGRMAMGFRPTEVSSPMDDYYGELARENRRTARKSQLIERLLRADTAADYNKILQDVDSFNYSLDERRDRINRGDVARLKSRRRSRQRQYDREHPRLDH